MIQKTGHDIIQSYFEDHSGLLGGHAERVVIPENEREIVEYLRNAAARNVPVTVSGAGTGVTGGRIPFGGDVLSLEALNSIGEVLTAPDGSKTISVGPGVRVQQLNEAVQPMGLMYPPGPTEQSSCIGGNAATNASGSRGLKYGSTRKYIRRLNLVLSNGETLSIRRGEIRAAADGYLAIPISSGSFRLKIPGYHVPRIKNAAGYFSAPGMDLVDLFIGQEGTLGVISEIEVALVPMIKRTFGGIAFFGSREKAWAFVEEVREVGRTSKMVEALSLEYFDHNALCLLRGDYPQIPAFAAAAILFEQDVSGCDEDHAMNAWGALLEKHGAPLESVWFATTGREQEAFRDFRHRLPERVNEIVKRNRLPKVGTDIAVPERAFKSMMQAYDEEFGPCGVDYLIFGHIGENHLHANILPKSENEYARSRELYGRLVERAVRFEGTVSAEHGIGKLKHAFLEKMVGPEGMREMARVKKSFDPALILSPGNIIPRELLATV